MNIEDLDPLKILSEAIRKVPALKYALGILGLLAILVIVTRWQLDLRVAVFGVLILVMLMIILVVFVKLSSLPSKTFVGPGVVLLWSTVSLSIAAIAFLGSSAFFSWPLNLSDWLNGEEGVITIVVNGDDEEKYPVSKVPIGNALALKSDLALRALSVVEAPLGQFYIGLTNHNEIWRMDKNGNLIGNGLKVPGEPTIILAADEQVFIATNFPSKIVVVPQDLSEISAFWDLPHDRAVLETFGKSESFDGGLPGEISSFTITQDSIWINASDNNASVIYRVDRGTDQWLIPEFYNFDIAFSGRDWGLHMTPVGVVAFTTETSPSSLYLLDKDSIRTFGGHDYDLVSSTVTVWAGKRGALGLLDAEDQIIEFDVENGNLLQKARLGTLPTRPVMNVWEIVRGQWENERYGSL